MFFVFTKLRYLSFADEDDGSADTNDCAIIAIKTIMLTAISPLVSFLSFIYCYLFYLIRRFVLFVILQNYEILRNNSIFGDEKPNFFRGYYFF